MIHISPCGWYCFELDNPNLEIKDSQEKTILKAKDESFEIELLSARKESQAIDDDISRIHEDYLVDEKILPTRTVLSENGFGVKFYVTTGTGMDENTWIVCHAFWNNYCVFIQYHGVKSRHASENIQQFYNVINGLQPLITA